MAGCPIPQKYTLDCLLKKADNPCPEVKHCVDAKPSENYVAGYGGAGYGGWNVCAFFVWWIILALIIGFIIFLFRPNFLWGRGERDGCHGRDRDRDGCGREGREGHDDCNWGSLVIWAIVIALVILIIFWIIWCFWGGYGSGYGGGYGGGCGYGGGFGPGAGYYR